VRAKLFYLLGYCVAFVLFVVIAIPSVPMVLEWYLDGIGRETKQSMFVEIPTMILSGIAAFWCAKQFFRQNKNEE
jgi:hypothetical protein